jgi:hypothetical protein
MDPDNDGVVRPDASFQLDCGFLGERMTAVDQ